MEKKREKGEKKERVIDSNGTNLKDAIVEKDYHKVCAQPMKKEGNKEGNQASKLRKKKRKKRGLTSQEG